MTREDANKLKRIMKERDDDNGGEPLNAVDRGYHLAYQHMCEELDKLVVDNVADEDLINRKEIIKSIIPMYREGEGCEYDRGHNDCWEQVIDKIKACPPDTHNIRRGKWIQEDALSSHCSECRQKILTCQNWFKYCPSCSAKMEVEQ